MIVNFYLFGLSFSLFLIILYAVFYFFLSKDSTLPKSKEEVRAILTIGFFYFLYSLFGLIWHLTKQNLFHFLMLSSGIFTLNSYVTLFRRNLISLKDSMYVETDGYKEEVKRYSNICYITSSLIILALFIIGVVLKDFKLIEKLEIVIVIYIIAFIILEIKEFNTMMKKEMGKVTKINFIRYNIFLLAGILSVIGAVIEIIMIFSGYRHIVNKIGSPYILFYCIAILIIATDLIFEYVGIYMKISESNEKLNELNSKMMEEIRTAQTLQISLLPVNKQKEIKKFIDIEISYMPMQSVGGDYYDFYALDNNKKILILLGDASGHGMYAAMIWSILKVEVEDLIEEDDVTTDICEAFKLLNRRIARILENTFSYATLFAGLIDLDTKKFSYISAGHTDQLYYFSEEKKVKKFKNKNPLIGTFKNSEYKLDVIQGKSGDCIVLFSDGITEGTNSKNEQLGIDRLSQYLEEVCNNNQNATSFDIMSELMLKLEEFYEYTLQQDDRTLFVVKL